MVEYEYAKALFELAIEDKKSQDYLESLNIVTNIYNNEPDIKKVLDSPIIEKNNKIDIIEKSFKVLQADFVSFLKVLINNGRFNLIKVIKDEYVKLLNEYNKIISVKVLSSIKLSKDEIKKIKKHLMNKYQNSKLVIECIIDSSISYGIKVLVNDEIIDMSLNNLLYQMKESL